MKCNLHTKLACAAVLAIVGCAGADHHSQVSGAREDDRVREQQAHGRLETITYEWESFRIEVSFHRQARDASWIMMVQDSWDVLDQAAQEEEMVWDLSACKCSMEECLWILDQSLEDFRAEKPDARLDSLHIEMQICKDLWGEILPRVARRLSTLEGKKPPDATNYPKEVDHEIERVAERSPTIAAIRLLLARHGMETKGPYLSWHVLFKDSLSGRKWSDIATLPGLGILVPGMFDFDFGDSRIR